MELTYTEWRRFDKRLKKLAEGQAEIGRQVTFAILTLRNLMQTVAEIRQHLADTKVILQQLIDFVVANDAAQAALKQKIADLVAAAAVAQAAKDALQLEIDAAFAEAEDLENTARAGLPGVPPVGGTPLGQTYADAATFNAAVSAYTGDEQVTLDGAEVKAAANGSTLSLAYFTHSADGHIDTTGPTD